MKKLIFNEKGVNHDGLSTLYRTTNAVRMDQNREPMGILAFTAVLVSHMNAITEPDSKGGPREPGRHSKSLATAVRQLADKNPAPAEPLEEARSE